MKIIQLIIAACLISSPVACDRSSGNVAAPVGPTSEISPTFEQTKAPMESTATATLSPVATRTVTSQKKTIPAPTATSTPIPLTPTSAPLSQTGPWMLLSKGTSSSGPMPYIDPILTNADGSAWEPLNLPHPKWAKPEDQVYYFIDPAPSGPYIVARPFLELYSLNCDENAHPTEIDPYDDMLYIIRLPENEPVQKIQLHGLKAIAQAQKEDCNLHDGEIPSVIGVTSLQVNGSWSPDHRYLVFSAAPDGPAADLYLFDRQADTIRRLTTRQNNPKLLGWSPDGQTIIYMGVSKMAVYHSWVSESSGLYAVSLSGTDRLLLKPKYVPGWLGWLSSSEFIIKDGLCEPVDFGTSACNVDLVTIDLSTGKYQTIYKDIHNWVNYVTDPNNHLLLFEDLPIEMLGKVEGNETPTPSSNGAGKSHAEGIYQYNFQTHSFHPIPLNDKPDNFYWDNAYQAFHYEVKDQEPPYAYRSSLVRYVYGLGFRTEEMTASPNISPDGEWQIGIVNKEQYILDRFAHPMQKLSGNWGHWAPDSSSFIQIVEKIELGETWLIVYLRKNNWQNPFIRRLFTGFDWRGKWIAP